MVFQFEDGQYYLVIMVSRNKDNKEVPGFKERRKCYLWKAEGDKLQEDFGRFVHNGVDGEMSRLYVSISDKNLGLVRNKLIHRLVDDETVVERINRTIASIADGSCSNYKRWLLDFDSKDYDLVCKFLSDLDEIDLTLSPRLFETPNGYAIIVEHGFDTREIKEKYSEVLEVKKDSPLCIQWARKGAQ